MEQIITISTSTSGTASVRFEDERGCMIIRTADGMRTLASAVYARGMREWMVLGPLGQQQGAERRKRDALAAMALIARRQLVEAEA